MPAAKTTSKVFDAVLERGANNLGWTIIRIPFDAAKLWGKRGQLRVSGEINGFSFRTSLFRGSGWNRIRRRGQPIPRKSCWTFCGNRSG